MAEKIAKILVVKNIHQSDAKKQLNNKAVYFFVSLVMGGIIFRVVAYLGELMSK